MEGPRWDLDDLGEEQRIDLGDYGGLSEGDTRAVWASGLVEGHRERFGEGGRNG